MVDLDALLFILELLMIMLFHSSLSCLSEGTLLLTILLIRVLLCQCLLLTCCIVTEQVREDVQLLLESGWVVTKECRL